MCSRLKYILFCILGPLLSGCSGNADPEGGGGNGGEPEGEVMLRLVWSAGDIPLVWPEESMALVNGVACRVSIGDDGVPVVEAEPSRDGKYELYYPAEAYSRSRKAFVVPPGQFPAQDGRADARSCPIYGSCTTAGETGDMDIQALCGILKLSITGNGRIVSVRIEDKSYGAVSGVFPFDPDTGVLNRSRGTSAIGWQVLNCTVQDGGIPLNKNCKEVYLVLPTGDYDDGMTVRVTDSGHRSCSFDLSDPFSMEAGKVTGISAGNYQPEGELLFEEHFDNLVWGCDYVGGIAGYGIGTGGSSPAPAKAGGYEPAYVGKNGQVPGTLLFESVDYTSAPAVSHTLSVSAGYLRSRQLFDWQRLYYAREYQGYIGGGDVGSYGNRGIIETPRMTGITEPCYAEVSFRICLERGLAGTIDCFASGGILTGCAVNGVTLDTDPRTGIHLSQSRNGASKTSICLSAGVFEPGRWHEVKLNYAAVSAGSSFRFQASTIRNANNCFWIDDIVVRRIGTYEGYGNCTVVEPTTARGVPADDVSSLYLRPGGVMSISADPTYTATGPLGMTHISPSLPAAEAEWEQYVSSAAKMTEANGLKVWCTHLPYGSATAPRTFDLCAEGADRIASVEFFKRAIRAVAPMKPMNVLVHCNQTLAFGDGSSAANMALSLHELQLVADQIGAHVVVENMSYGVGADVEVLIRAVDAANAMGSHKYEIRIAMDTGHANLYLKREKPGETVVDWLRAAGTRIGQLHVHGNRGWRGSITDDHLTPGYAGMLGIADTIGEDGLWGEFYYILLDECLYRGPFTYELSSRPFGQVNGEDRYDQINSPWHIFHNYNTYLYPAFREYCKKNRCI